MAVTLPTHEHVNTKDKRGDHFRVSRNPAENSMEYGAMQVCLLADIRDTLVETRQALRAILTLLDCVNTRGIPATLKAIEANTKKRPYVRRQKPAEQS